MAPAATEVASHSEEERLPYILYRSRIKKSTGPARVVEGPVPFIDLEGLNDQERRSSTINQIGEACANYGFFGVKNHGVPQAIRTKMLHTTIDFFNLPEEEKLQYTVADGQRKKFELVVGNHFNGKTKQADNSWREVVKFPFEDNMEGYPTNPPSFRADITEYSASMRVLVKTLLEAISESLGLEKDCVEKTIKNHRLSASFNQYPVCPNPEENLGAIPHSDPSVITVVQLDDVPGLQFDHDGNWLPVNPVPETLVINVGDILQVISNDRYRSTCHRVTATYVKKRMSLACFCFPASDAIIGPAEELVDADHPALHAYFPFPFGQFLGNIIKRGEPSNCA